MINIAMFDNEDKQGNQPDMKGYNKDLDCSIAGWWKTASNGSRYLSVRIETKEDKQAQVDNIKAQVADESSARQPHPKQDSTNFNFDQGDEIPW